MILAHAAASFAHVPATLGMFFQEEGGAASSGFSVLGMLKNMGWIDLVVVGILFIMSIWSLAVMIDRALYFSAARKQSREFAPKVAGALKDGRLDEAIKVADRSKKSHLAEVVTAGLQEFRSYGSGGAISDEQIESSKRALERSEAIVHAKLKRGLGSLATIGSTAWARVTASWAAFSASPARRSSSSLWRAARSASSARRFWRRARFSSLRNAACSAWRAALRSPWSWSAFWWSARRFWRSWSPCCTGLRSASMAARAVWCSRAAASRTSGPCPGAARSSSVGTASGDRWSDTKKTASLRW